MNLVEIYFSYRKINKQMHSKIIKEFIIREDIIGAGKLFGVWENNALVFNNPDEVNNLMDFSIYEKGCNRKSRLDEFIGKYGDQLKKERIVLEAMQGAETSLCEVVGFDRENEMILLQDLFNDGKRINLVDVGFSRSVNVGTLIFARFIKFDLFYMTSGIGFTYLGEHKQSIMRKSKRLMKKMNSGDSSIDRIVIFFKLNETDGIPIMFREL